MNKSLNQKRSGYAVVLLLTLSPVASYATGFISAGSWTAGSAGPFNRPNAIAIDTSNNVYVSDVINNRIQSFDSVGNSVSYIGGPTAGTAAGQFNHPTGITVDSTNKVIVSDSYNNRIQLLGAGFTAGTAFGSIGTGNGQFVKAAGVDRDSNGNIYVADSFSNCRVQKFNSSGAYVSKWGSCANTDATIPPTLVDGTFGNGDALSTNALLKLPAGDIAVNRITNEIYVTDLVLNRVQKFNSSGTFVKKWGSFGTGNGQFNKPAGIAIDSVGNVYIADLGNKRIQKFNSDGVFIATFGNSSIFTNPQDVAIDSHFNLYVTDFDAANTNFATAIGRLQKFTPNFNLTLNPSTNGTVAITGGTAIAGGSCGSNCTVYGNGTVVLTATPATGYHVSSWGNACVSMTATTCTVAMNDDKIFTPVFAANSVYNLSAQKIGSGTVTGPGISCGAVCSYNYSSGYVATLTATPATGQSFISWAGCDSTATNTCTVTMNAAKYVTATFTSNPPPPSTYLFTLTKTGTGTGTVTGPGINCGTTCSYNYPTGYVSTLIATPTTGQSFTGWVGCDSSTATTCTVTMSAIKNVTATFSSSAPPPSNYLLTANKINASSGKITGPGINCGTACSYNYPTGYVATLTATPVTGKSFTGWTGCDSTATNTCTVTMNAVKNVTATFTP